MANSRLLTSFTLDDDNNDLRFEANSTEQTVTVATGTYYHSDDDSASDFIDVLETALETHAQVTTALVEIIDVGLVDATRAPGRLKFTITTTTNAQFVFSHAESTIDPRLLGFPDDGTDSSNYLVSSGTAVGRSSWVHRYGWYPQIDADLHVTDRRLRNSVEMSSGGYISGLPWGTDQLVALAFPSRRPALVRQDAVIGANATDVLTTALDLNIAFESWCNDLVADPDKKWRFYEDSTDTTAPGIEYRFGPGSNLWLRPLSGSTAIAHKAGELWQVGIDGQEAR